MEDATKLLKKGLSLLDKKKIPNHVAIIMDGNRRWAKREKLPLLQGHKQGAENLIEIVKAAIDLKIKILTVYVFSTENWNRSKIEVNILMNLFKLYLIKYTKVFKEESIKVKIIGNIKSFSSFLQKTINKVIVQTEKGNKIELVLAMNYGGRDEITRAVKNIIYDYENKKIKLDDITEKMFSSYLDTNLESDPNLLIRTGGEHRLSNFLLWQSSYTEFLVTDMFWPEFSKKHFFQAILEYQKRKRRYGI